MRIAFIGVGAMGRPMARRLMRLDDVDLCLHDASPERLAEMAGEAETASTIAAAVDGADAVFTVLPADEHVLAVAAEYAVSAVSGQTFVDFSTIGPETIESVAARLGARGVDTVSVCLTRSTAAAQAGELALFVGGPSELDEPLRRAFDVMATDVHLIGGLAAPKAFKLANNMVVSCLDVAICEALVLGRLLGLADREVTEALAAHGADSWPLHHHIEKYVLPDDLGPGRFSTRYMSKDVELALRYGAERGVPLHFAAMALAFYRGTVAMGHGDDYHMIVIEWMRRSSGSPASAAARQLSDGEALGALAKAVWAVQALISLEALELISHAGVGALDAADLFEHGSAGNDFLRAVSARGDGGSDAVTPRQIVDALGPVNDIARMLSVPALTFEVGRAAALSTARLRGADQDLVPR